MGAQPPRREVMTEGKNGMSGWRVILDVVGALLGFLALAVAGCGSSPGLCRCPPPPNQTVIELGCVPVAPPVVKTIGPCAVCSTLPANSSTPEGFYCEVFSNPNNVTLITTGAGTCHVEVTFGNGTTSFIDLDFESEWRACGSDPHGCGQAFIPVAPDASPGRLSLPDPTCATGVHAAASN
jgi:hypothetical protein